MLYLALFYSAYEYTMVYGIHVKGTLEDNFSCRPWKRADFQLVTPELESTNSYKNWRSRGPNGLKPIKSDQKLSKINKIDRN